MLKVTGVTDVTARVTGERKLSCALSRVLREENILGLELTYQGGWAFKARTTTTTLSAEPSRPESLRCGRSGLGPAVQPNAGEILIGAAA